MNDGKAIGIIMTYNCSHLLEDAYSRIPKESLQGLIIVDDHSKDWEKTQSIAQRLGVPFFTHEHMGYGGNLRYGLTKAMEMGAAYMVEIHGDGQFDPLDIPKLLLPVIQGRADFTTCSRFKDKTLTPKMPKAKLWGNALVANIISFIIGKRIYDASCGFRAYSREALLRLNL